MSLEVAYLLVSRIYYVFATWNVEGLLDEKFYELECIMDRSSMYILCVQETLIVGVGFYVLGVGLLIFLFGGVGERD